MILYKYVSHETLEIILSKNTLRFNNPELFNDPFDCAATLTANMSSDWNTTYRAAAMSNTLKMHHHRNKCGVLCLTRNPLNALMWAHYGCNHTGAVLGIDVGLAGLEDKSQYTITANSGNVVYTSVRPSHLETTIPSSVDSSTDRSILEKMYLQKSIHWAYEEEVRIVKTINPDFKLLSELADGNTHEDIIIPAPSIKEVYLGYRYNHAAITNSKTSTPEKKESHHLIKFYNCLIDSVTWDLKPNRA